MKNPFSSLGLTQKLFLIVIAAMAIIHFYPYNNIFQRQLINHDDLLFVEPLKHFSIDRYFTERLSDPHSYAFPLRDLFWKLELFMGEILKFEVFWIFSFIFFTLYLHSSLKLLQVFFPHRLKWQFVLLTIIAFHPLNIEVVQWASIQRILIPAWLMVQINYWYFKKKMQNEELIQEDWIKISLLFWAGLLCYPHASFWPLYILFLERKTLLKNRKLFTQMAAIHLLFFIPYWKALVVKKGSDYASLTSKIYKLEFFDQNIYNGLRSLGRGTYNLLFPHRLFPYYDEEHILNYVGLLLALMLIVVLGLLLIKIWEKKSPVFRQSMALFTLSLLLFGPQSIIFLTYDDFVWADRYCFISFPYFIIAIGLLIDFEWKNPTFFVKKFQELLNRPDIPFKPHQLGYSLFAIWIVLVSSISFVRVPLWHSHFSLMNECAKNEQSPKCLIIAVRNAFFDLGCQAAAPYIYLSSDRWKNKLPPYSFEFNLEIPFYHGMCIALLTRLTTKEKFQSLPEIKTLYRDAKEVSFAEILVHLENGDKNNAFQTAKRYYLSGSSIPILSTKGLVNLYHGQAKALCEIIQDRSCDDSFDIFKEQSNDLPNLPWERSWAYQITKKMFERSLIIAGPDALKEDKK